MIPNDFTRRIKIAPVDGDDLGLTIQWENDKRQLVFSFTADVDGERQIISLPLDIKNDDDLRALLDGFTPRLSSMVAAISHDLARPSS